VIAATVLAVIASSWPLFIGWFDGERPTAAKPGIARALRGRGWAFAPREAGRPHEMFGPDGDTEIPFDEPPNIPHLLPPHDAPSDAFAGTTARPRADLELLDRADPDGRPIIEVTPKDTLVVVREIPPWVLLAVKREGRLEFGWATRTQVEINR
jgi:hypothetical protein